MDKIDIKIIECLKKNARENASVIGSQVNMSVSAVIERIKKLEANGIIRQYTVVLGFGTLDKVVAEKANKQGSKKMPCSIFIRADNEDRRGVCDKITIR